MPERRKERRLPVFLDAKIGFDGRRFRLTCLLQNISGSGAKLVLLYGADVPSEFSLSICDKKFQSQYWARTRWQRGRAIGVEIEDLCSMDASGSANVK